MQKPDPGPSGVWFSGSLGRLFLFVGTAASADASAGGCEEGTCCADHGKDGGWVFGRCDTAVLSVQREGGGKEKSKAKEQGELLHWWISV